MALIDDLYIRILADGSQLGPGLNKANDQLDNFSNGVKKIGEVLGIAFSVDVVERFIMGCIEASDASERAIAKVAQAIKSTNAVAGQSLENLKLAADEFKNSTLFDDDTVLNDVSAQLLTFTNIAGENFKRAQQAALDLSTVLGDGEGLRGVSIQLGKALNDPVQGLNALRRSGISFSTEQVEVIKNLTETNRLAEAQGLILTELERQYGGQAKAAADASNGITMFKNSMDDGRKAVGKFMVEGIGLKGMLEGIVGVMTAAFSPNIPGSILSPFADHTERVTKVLGMDKPTEAAPEKSKPETTYEDLTNKLKQYQEELKSSTVATRDGINRQIEIQKGLIKAWEDSGKAVVDYTGTIKGLGLEITALEEKKNTTKNNPMVIAQLGELIEKKKEEKKVLENASMAWVAYGATVVNCIDEITPKVGKVYTTLNVGLQDSFAVNNALLAKLVKSNKDFSTEMSNNLKSAISTVASSLGALIGDLANGSKGAGDTLLSFLGKIIGQVGQMAIGIGSAMLAINLTLTNPTNPMFAIGLIAAGVAAVAIGQMFSNSSKSIASGGSAGGSYGSSSSSNTYDTRAAQASIPTTIKLVLDGRDMVASIKLNQVYYSRQG